MAELNEMDAGEFMLWVALITNIEPAEEKKRSDEAKRNRGR